MSPQVTAQLESETAALLRSDLYALLAALLAKPPSAPFLDQIGALTCAPETPASLCRALDELKETAVRTDAAELAIEYDDLFVGMGRGQVVPYASWYDRQLMMDAPLASLRGDLAALNIRRRSGITEPEDHAAAVCETMALIIDSAGRTSEHQAAFFNAHLTPWLERFFRDLQQARSAVFYRTVGRLGECFMRLETDILRPNPGRQDEPIKEYGL